MMGRLGKALKPMGGQAAAEFILVVPFFIAAVFGIMMVGYAYMQRADVDFQLSQLASDLPADWQTMSKTELVKELMCSDSTLNPSELTVKSADISIGTEIDVVEDDEIAAELGAGLARTQVDRVLVEADVEYKVDDAFTLGHDVVYARHITRSYVANNEFEVS